MGFEKIEIIWKPWPKNPRNKKNQNSFLDLENFTETKLIPRRLDDVKTVLYGKINK